MNEDDVLRNYSPPGLRKNQLNRAAKRDHLDGLKVPRDEREKILDELYHTAAIQETYLLLGEE